MYIPPHTHTHKHAHSQFYLFTLYPSVVTVHSFSYLMESEWIKKLRAHYFKSATPSVVFHPSPLASLSDPYCLKLVTWYIKPDNDILMNSIIEFGQI